MMEKTQMGKGNRHTVFIRSFNHMVIPNGSACFRYILHTAAVGPFNVVTKGEEGIAAQRNSAYLR